MNGTFEKWHVSPKWEMYIRVRPVHVRKTILHSISLGLSSHFFAFILIEQNKMSLQLINIICTIHRLHTRTICHRNRFAFTSCSGQRLERQLNFRLKLLQLIDSLNLEPNNEYGFLLDKRNASTDKVFRNIKIWHVFKTFLIV